MVAKFGPAGNPEAFYAAGYKASVDMPAWLQSQELAAYEYQCSRGVHIREQAARALGQAAREHGVTLSIHAPYYISLATQDEKIQANTVRHFLQSLAAAQWMGATRVVFHPGGPGKMARATAWELARRAFIHVLDEAEKDGLLAGVTLCPETMGKPNQLGTLAEVLDLCRLHPAVRPAVDFAHLHAASGGAYTTAAEMRRVFAQVGETLDDAAARDLHIHFSHIEYTKGGEKRHWNFSDPFGPPYEPLIQVIAAHDLSPTVICESAGQQAHDARLMQDLYYNLRSQPDGERNTIV